MTQRREFLGGCAASAVALMTPASLMAAGSAPKAATSALSRDAFDALTQSTFRCLSGSGQAVDLKLAKVLHGPQSPKLDQFTLVLSRTSDSDAELAEGIYQLRHPKTGAMLVRLAPSDSTDHTYIAHFAVRA
ncbi:DUF6916 family protein [Nitrogeniibacter aestuarii]|uniref:DUF6916 family protein n=1 Tax=Nitrogeniibacter aestuarii TaxID=2815343 RepID=UPI001D1153A8|nr:hypothetical protein [Nitrogeniibacter aestuarii]